jgi:EAL domain-containing protein (putative c-di-GMP-specific phosphodiesterase class I)
MTVALNVSTRQFHSESFIEDLLAVLRDTDMAPKVLELEVTQSLLMKRPEFTALMQTYGKEESE